MARCGEEVRMNIFQQMFTGQKFLVGMKSGKNKRLLTPEQQFKVEFECEFLGSVDTLIAPSKLRTLVYDNPKTRNAGLDVYEPGKENHDYVMTVDVARGVGEDYSAFVVVDITEFPHRSCSKI